MHLILVYIPVGNIPPENVPTYIEGMSQSIGKLPNSKVWLMPVGPCHPHPTIRVEIYDLDGDLPDELPEPIALKELLDSAEQRQPKEPTSSGSLEILENLK
jgi:hypothetical protein